MLFDRFLQWTALAPAQARADAAQALIGAYSHIGRDRDRADRLDRMVAVLLDDPSILVRRALSEAASRSVDVPRCIVVALTGDDAIVAAPVLAASPLLSEADLMEAVATGDSEAHLAVAGRPGISEKVAAALAELGQRDAVLALLRHDATDVAAAVLRFILQRFRADAEVREALLRHAHVDPVLHHELVVASTDALTRFAIACHWMSPARADGLRRDSHDKGVVTIAHRCSRRGGPTGPQALVQHLRSRAALTPALLLRALLSNDLGLCEAALSHLSRLAPHRVTGHMRAPESLGFASLYAKAGLPPTLLPVFRAALRAARTSDEGSFVLSRIAVSRVLQACADANAPDLARVIGLLRRFEAEALRDGVRADGADEAEPVRHPGAGDLAAVRVTRAPRLLEAA